MTDGHAGADHRCVDRWISGGEKTKRLSEMQKQIVAFIPRPCRRRVMALLGTQSIPSDRLGALWTPVGGAGLMEGGGG